MTTKNANMKNGFVISSMSDMSVNHDNLISTNALVDALNQKLKISNYSDKVQEVGLIFMAIDPSSHSFRPDKKIWRWKSSVFDTYINVPDYEVFCKATEIEAQQIVGNMFLQGIKTHLSKRTDIDHKRLYADVKQVFEKINAK